jgi:hypothetical protein
MCNGCYKCRHLFSVLTSGPMTVSAQRGTCHMRTDCRGPEVKTQKCMHKYYMDICINFVLHDMFYCAVFNLCNFIMHVGLNSSYVVLL